ncbi:MAG: hypothetical protein IT299_08180 [Dehalococcoidia bacterium]|nr:hypothetical protein [Dehalococcoidia bacterium]
MTDATSARRVRASMLGVVLAAGLVAAMAVLLLDRTPATAAPSGRVTWAGKDRFLAGANVPWFNWGCDFGCGASGGVSDPAVRAALDERFGRFRATGLDTLRWWMFEPGQPGQIAQIRRGASGALEVSPTVYADLDAALALAEQHDLYFVFVLFAGVSPDLMPREWLDDPAMRQQLATALGTMFSRYASSPRILAWEIVNEPEWQIWNGLASEANTVALAGLIEREVHARSQALVTLGQATLDGIPMWQSVRLDFHSPHYYSPMTWASACAACRDYASIASGYRTSLPVVIGEWDAPDSATTDERWRHWYDSGYAGAWAWSIFPEKTNDRIAFGYASARAFASSHALTGTAATAAPPPASVPTTGQPLVGAIPGPGSVALMVVGSGGAPSVLADYLARGGCTPAVFALLEGGAWRTYVLGAPAAVNRNFPATLTANVPLFVRCS